MHSFHSSKYDPDRGARWSRSIGILIGALLVASGLWALVSLVTWALWNAVVCTVVAAPPLAYSSVLGCLLFLRLVGWVFVGRTGK